MFWGKKGSTAVFVVLILLSLFIAGGIFYLLQQERAKNVLLTRQLEEVKAQQKIAEIKLEDSKKTIAALEFRIEEVRLEVDNLSKELEAERSAKAEAFSQIEQLKADLEQQKKIRADLENKLTQAQKYVNKIKSDLSNLEFQKTELETKIKDLETECDNVELGKIVVSPENEAEETREIASAAEEAAVPSIALTKNPKEMAGASNLEGKVLVVNREYNFAVVNLGGIDKVEIGDEFSVYHDYAYIGDIKIEKIHDSMSAAGFVTEGLKDKISEGDTVITKKQ